MAAEKQLNLERLRSDMILSAKAIGTNLILTMKETRSCYNYAKDIYGHSIDIFKKNPDNTHIVESDIVEQVCLEISAFFLLIITFACERFLKAPISTVSFVEDLLNETLMPCKGDFIAFLDFESLNVRRAQFPISKAVLLNFSTDQKPASPEIVWAYKGQTPDDYFTSLTNIIAKVLYTVECFSRSYTVPDSGRNDAAYCLEREVPFVAHAISFLYDLSYLNHSSDVCSCKRVNCVRAKSMGSALFLEEASFLDEARAYSQSQFRTLLESACSTVKSETGDDIFDRRARRWT
jgi:hypothetical protein